MTSKYQRYSMTTCKECGSDRETIQNGYIVCTECGITKDREYVDHHPCKKDEDKASLSHNSIGKNMEFIGSLGTKIGYSSKILRGPRGDSLKQKIVNKYRRLIKFHHERAQIDSNSTHLRTMIAFNKVFNKFELSVDIKKRTLYLYWKYVKEDHDITNHVLLIAVCLLRAVREAESRAPIRFSEIVNGFAENGHRVTNKNILRLARELDISFAPIRRKAEDYVERIAAQIRINDQILYRLSTRNLKPGEYELLLIKIANEFLNQLGRRDRGGVQPYPFAVSIIYLADRALARAQQKKTVLTQKLLANAADSAEYTIRDHVYRFLGDLYEENEKTLIQFAKSKIP